MYSWNPQSTYQPNKFPAIVVTKALATPSSPLLFICRSFSPYSVLCGCSVQEGPQQMILWIVWRNNYLHMQGTERDGSGSSSPLFLKFDSAFLCTVFSNSKYKLGILAHIELHTTLATLLLIYLTSVVYHCWSYLHCRMEYSIECTTLQLRYAQQWYTNKVLV